jgi:hypothetical protein
MRNKIYILFSLVILASFVLGACAQPAAPTPETIIQTVVVEKEGQTVVETVEVEVTAAPPEVAPVEWKSKDPTTFTYVTFGEPDSLDPAFDYETAGGEILQNVYETLVTYEGNYESKLVPLLAESWEVSEDGKTYTFKIQPGVKPTRSFVACCRAAPTPRSSWSSSLSTASARLTSLRRSKWRRCLALRRWRMALVKRNITPSPSSFTTMLMP